MVRFIPTRRAIYYHGNFGLNSTMVRFIQSSFSSRENIPGRSQFHYGSIHTNITLAEFRAVFESQFHYGSIHTKDDYGIKNLSWLGLNSTMVRFILRKAELLLLEHNCLNSTMVRFIRAPSMGGKYE